MRGNFLKNRKNTIKILYENINIIYFLSCFILKVGRILQEDDGSPIGPVDSLLCQNRHQRTASLRSAKANSTK